MCTAPYALPCTVAEGNILNVPRSITRPFHYQTPSFLTVWREGAWRAGQMQRPLIGSLYYNGSPTGDAGAAVIVVMLG